VLKRDKVVYSGGHPDAVPAARTPSRTSECQGAHTFTPSYLSVLTLVQLSSDTHDALRRGSAAPTPSRHPSPRIRLPRPHTTRKRRAFGLSRDRMAPALRVLHPRPVRVRCTPFRRPRYSIPSTLQPRRSSSSTGSCPRAASLRRTRTRRSARRRTSDFPHLFRMLNGLSLDALVLVLQYRSAHNPSSAPFHDVFLRYLQRDSRRPTATCPRPRQSGKRRAGSYSRPCARWCSRRRARVPAGANQLDPLLFGMRMLRSQLADAADSACDSCIDGARDNHGV
jgi:hypothetical protein